MYTPSQATVLDTNFWIINDFQPTERSRNEEKAQNTMKRIGQELMKERKEALLQGKEEEDDDNGTRTKGKDLLSALIKANLDTELPDSQRLSDDDVLARTLRLYFLVIIFNSPNYA